MTRIINAGQYDIVHTHGARSNLFLSLIRKRIRARWCVTVHSDPYLDFSGRGLQGRIFTGLNLRALRKADCIFAITKRFANLLSGKGKISPAKIHVIYNGIFYQPDSVIPSKLKHRGFNLINVARTERVKGQDLLLQAVKDLPDSSLHLHIVGSGSQLADLKRRANQLGVASAVTFHGFLRHKQIDQLYRSADLAVLTSYSESFPLVLLEAADNLVPLMSTDVGDIRRLIPDGRHGFVARRGDLDSITAAIKKAAATPQNELAQMAGREKAYCSEHFSVSRQLADIMKVYHKL